MVGLRAVLLKAGTGPGECIGNRWQAGTAERIVWSVIDRVHGEAPAERVDRENARICMVPEYSGRCVPKNIDRLAMSVGAAGT